ncbi:MAG TPA: carboxylesterase/lipase family protein [Puia sp.]|nr:carboxylesterase/lipase family protein [Puia sp.]
MKIISPFLLLIALNTSAQSPVVKTNEGYIKGLIENGIAVFKGIPYAQPPMGNLRYMPPVAHSPWADTLNTVQFGSSALQPSGAAAAGSEDCLYLNLYTPMPDHHKRAVVIWVHGGSMTAGSGKGMNGHAFADKDDIVTITINYRLGALGFLYLDDLDRKYSQSGNLGLLDVIAALQWVHENIAAFGGDPARVTVMGESAGAKLLSAVMVSPASKGLYRQAILESGSVQCIRDSSTAKNERALLLKQLGLGPDDAARLLTLPADVIIKAQGKICAGIGGNSFFGPVLDGVTIPEDAYKYAARHKLSGIKAIIGTNENEGAAFVAKNDANPAILKPLFRSNAPMADAYYETLLKTDSPYAAMVKTVTQYMYQLHSYRFAKALTDAGTSVWVYRYRYQDGKEFGARHGDELHYIWGATGILNSNDDPAKKQLAKSLHGAWVAFIKTGNPNGESLPQWPKYSDNTRQIMAFDAVDTVIQLKKVYNDKNFPSAVFVL